MLDLVPISRFVHRMEPLKLIYGGCPICGVPHFFLFVHGVRPEDSRIEDWYQVEPFMEDSARPPK